MRLARSLLITGLILGLSGCVSFDNSPDPPDDAPPLQVAALDPGGAFIRPPAEFKGDRFRTRDGASLPLRSWLPPGPPSAVVLALHGFNDYSNAFARPAPRLVAQGIAVYAYDQRGFGAAPRRGRWAGTETMVEDAVDGAAILRKRYPGRPVYLLGESMGGAVAILAAARPRGAEVDGVVLAAPAVWGRQTMNVFERAGLWIASLMPSMQVSRRTLPVEVHATDNMAVLRELSLDPLVIKDTRSDAVNGLVDLMGAALAAAPRLDMPTLVLYGEHDEIVPRGPVERMAASLPRLAESRVAFYRDGYHLLLRDLHAATVLDDVAAWLADHRAALPSGADESGRALRPAVQASAPGATEGAATN